MEKEYVYKKCFCDRCGEKKELKFLGEKVTDSDGFTHYNKFEKPEVYGWNYVERKLVCDKCFADYKAIMKKFWDTEDK